MSWMGVVVVGLVCGLAGFMLGALLFTCGRDDG